MSDHAIALWTLIVTTIALVFGIIAVGVAWWTVRDNARTAKAQFWILLRGVFANYDDVHAEFRPGGAWHGSSTEPASTENRAKTEIYMGLFEYCDALLERNLIEYQQFYGSYKYRLDNILTNRWIIEEKLKNRRSGWLGFINLCYRLKIIIPGVNPLSPEEHKRLYVPERLDGSSRDG